MKNIFKKIFNKKSKNELFVEAENFLYNHFKGEFGDKIKCTVQISDAMPKDDLLRGDCKQVMTPSYRSHFIHFLP